MPDERTPSDDSEFPRARTTKRGRPQGRFGPKATAIREAVLALTDEFRVMTVRQVFYALTTRGVVPKDEARGYRPVQEQVLRMRRDGVLPWAFIADNTRWIRKPNTYDHLDDALHVVERTYRRNLWRAQGVRIEVWLERDALAGVVSEVTHPWDVPLMVSRGTSSATFLHSAAEFASDAYYERGVETVVLALYDYDAAGRRAARNVERGLREHAPYVPIEFCPLAVQEAQIDAWNLPTHPPKRSDPESHKFDRERAVELDAIPPDLLLGLIGGAIREYVDDDAWRREQVVEDSERELLARILDRTGDD
jgi:hypothetical protein